MSKAAKRPTKVKVNLGDVGISKTKFNQFYKDIIDNIRGPHGRFILGVFGDENLSFSYTIGNHGRGLPELLVIGPHTGTYLNELSQRMIEREKPFRHGEIINMREKYRVKVIDATRAAHENYTIQVGQFYESEDYRVQQVILSDTNGKFPGDEGCEEPFASVPVLALS
jgi:hypothetical protein